MKNIAAALIFFTRFPFWRLFSVDSQYYKQVINYWAVVGWLTGGVMALVLWLAAQILPFSIAVIIAILSRIIITGALHEDGFADFFDGFGGGTTKDRILAIMKDSHIGTYGVVSLIFYFILLFSLLSSMSLHWACLSILAGDPLCKFIASMITLRLPYARNEESSKAKVVYNKMSFAPFWLSAIFGLLPFLIFIPFGSWWIILLPVVVFLMMTSIMNKKIGGYTGDCCGATFLICELFFYIGMTVSLFEKV